MDQPKTPDQLKVFLRAEMEKRNPKLINDFESFWQAMAPMLKTEHQIRSFLQGYSR